MYKRHKASRGPHSRALLDELDTRVQVNENGQRKLTTKLELVFKHAVNAAVGGDYSVLPVLVKLLQIPDLSKNELHTRVRIWGGGRPTEVTKLQLIYINVVNSAARGDRKASRTLLKLLEVARLDFEAPLARDILLPDLSTLSVEELHKLQQQLLPPKEQSLKWLQEHGVPDLSTLSLKQLTDLYFENLNEAPIDVLQLLRKSCARRS
jgi:hypothetical protein